MHKVRQVSGTTGIKSVLEMPVSKAPFGAPTNAASSFGEKKIVEVDFRQLAGGTLVEMIEDPQDSSKAILAICEDEIIRYAAELEGGNQVIRPLARSNGIIRTVRLADGSEDYGAARDLWTNIRRLLRWTLDLSAEHEFLLASFIMSTYFIEKLSVAPYVAFVGLPGSGKTTALRVLDLICRRSVLTTDISSAAFYEICDQMTPTVLIDEVATAANRKEILRLLRASSTQGFVAIRKGESYRSYGARCFTWVELPDDDALNSRCIVISMNCSQREDLLPLEHPTIVRLAQKVRRQLLQFRLLNFGKLKPCSMEGEADLRPRTRDLLRALALPFQDDQQICRGLLLSLKDQQSLRTVLSVSQAAVLDCLMESLHGAYMDYQDISMVHLTQRVNERLENHGELISITEKKLGNILTSLSLTNRFRLNSGWILLLDRTTREEIHSLFRTHRMPLDWSNEPAAKCEFCNQVRANQTDAVPMKEIDKSSERIAANTSSGEPRERHERINAKQPNRKPKMRRKR